tara:strand:+ start:168 stop:446 length:279 start_codon:yes stop_codon:yes gene_type:complete
MEWANSQTNFEEHSASAFIPALAKGVLAAEPSIVAEIPMAKVQNPGSGNYFPSQAHAHNTSPEVKSQASYLSFQVNFRKFIFQKIFPFHWHW